MTMELELKEPCFLVATNNVQLEKFGNVIDGKYFVKKVNYSIDSGGYSIRLSVRKIKDSIKQKEADSENKGTQPQSQGQEYVVRKGDNLWTIARKVYKKGELYKQIYEKNKDVIEKTARSKGRKSSNGGKYIYPGTRLIL